MQGASAVRPVDKLSLRAWDCLPLLCIVCPSPAKNLSRKLQLAAAMASTAPLLPLPLPLPPHHPSSALRSISSASVPPAPSFLSRSNWCSATQSVAGEVWEPRVARRAVFLRASAGSEVAAAPVEKEDGPTLPCDSCNGKGWLLCDFCKGQKTNVQVRANKFYRRCPSCRAVGVVICPQCKVFKCVSFPDGADGY